MTRRLAQLLFSGLLALTAAGSPALAQGKSDDAPAPLPLQARGVDVEEHVGQSLPPDLLFTDAEGRTVRLGDYFKGGASGKPAIMAMVYYKCPVVCTVVMQRMAETINQLDLTVGKDYNALIFSFDPTEKTRDAAQTKLGFISGYPKDVTPEVEAGWEFHTSTSDEAPRKLADALGFRYQKINTGYSHPVALFIITPDGKISRYLYGFEYPARDVKLALLEASQGKLVKTIGDRLMNYCFLYDAAAGKYTIAVHRVMQVAGAVTAAALGTFIAGLVVREKVKKAREVRAALASAKDHAPPSIVTVALNQPHHPGGGTT
jgi:protein SCO1/2